MRRRPSSSALAAVSLLCVVLLGACNCAPILRYLSIAPASASIDAGTQQQFTATAYYTDGSFITGAGGVSWSSSNTSVATISTVEWPLLSRRALRRLPPPNQEHRRPLVLPSSNWCPSLLPRLRQRLHPRGRSNMTPSGLTRTAVRKT